MAYQPPITFTNTFNTNNNKPKKLDEDLLGLGYSSTSSNSTVVKKNDSVSNRKKGNNSNQLFNPDDILSSFGSDFSSKPKK